VSNTVSLPHRNPCKELATGPTRPKCKALVRDSNPNICGKLNSVHPSHQVANKDIAARHRRLYRGWGPEPRLGEYKGRSISVSVHQFYLSSILTRFRGRWAIRAAHCIATRTGNQNWGQHVRNTKCQCRTAVPKPSADKISFTHNAGWPAS
jgi:hypothetical protein